MYTSFVNEFKLPVFAKSRPELSLVARQDEYLRNTKDTDEFLSPIKTRIIDRPAIIEQERQIKRTFAVYNYDPEKIPTFENCIVMWKQRNFAGTAEISCLLKYPIIHQIGSLYVPPEKYVVGFTGEAYTGKGFVYHPGMYGNVWIGIKSLIVYPNYERTGTDSGVGIGAGRMLAPYNYGHQTSAGYDAVNCRVRYSSYPDSFDSANQNDFDTVNCNNTFVPGLSIFNIDDPSHNIYHK